MTTSSVCSQRLSVAPKRVATKPGCTAIDWMGRCRRRRWSSAENLGWCYGILFRLSKRCLAPQHTHFLAPFRCQRPHAPRRSMSLCGNGSHPRPDAKSLYTRCKLPTVMMMMFTTVAGADRSLQGTTARRQPQCRRLLANRQAAQLSEGSRCQSRPQRSQGQSSSTEENQFITVQQCAPRESGGNSQLESPPHWCVDTRAG